MCKTLHGPTQEESTLELVISKNAEPATKSTASQHRLKTKRAEECPRGNANHRHTKGISNSAIQLYYWEGPELREPTERSAVSDCQCWSTSILLPTGSCWKEKDFSEI